MKRLFDFDRKFIMIPVLAVYLLGVAPFGRAVFFSRSALALAVPVEHDAQRISSKCNQYGFQAVLVKGKMPGLFYCCAEGVYPVDQRSSRRSAAAADQSEPDNRQSEHHQSGGARCRTSFVRSHRCYLWLPDAIRISLYAQKFIGTSVYRIPLTSVDESVRPIVRLTTAAASARVM